MNQQQNHEQEMGRPGDGFLAEAHRRAALTNQQEVGEMFTVDPTPSMGEELDWRARAACRDADPELFSPTPINGAALVAAERRALSVCRVCPVLATCRSWAIVDQPHGIAGGLTEDTPRRAGRAERPAVVPGPSPRTDRAPVIAAGHTALTAGADRGDIARTLGVTRRTVDHWAAALAIPAGGGR